MALSNSEEKKPSYFEIDIRLFRDAVRDIDFDLYLKLSEDNYAHVFSRATGLDYQRLSQYIAKKVRVLYAREEDKKKVDSFLSRPANDIFYDPDATVGEKVASLLNMTEQNMTEIFSQMDVPKETIVSTKKVINNYVHLLAEQPKTLATIIKLASHGDYLYYHSISTAILSLFISKASGQFNRRTLEMIGMGGFLHDIGCTQLPEHILDTEEDLDPSDWQLMRQHPKLGLSMIEGTPNIPDEVRYMVYQHHEEPGGNGYPNGIRSPVIYFPAKIVAIADAFGALITKRPHRPAYSVSDALRIIESEKGKFDAELVKVLVSIFERKRNAA
ncbi:MAG: hypothetical protein CL678_06875 [Bdellovibrionaceae bacterium]|nr:hypothetical protein [Pseudobdellovibrionaceae bacterium]|tara:strand:- start:1965 stop:2951 length:987 start_codon:yes stop_codon:yes gene_type:complete